MHSRLKAAPTITLSERDLLGFSWVRTSLQEVTVLLGVNWRTTNKQIIQFNSRESPVLPARLNSEAYLTRVGRDESAHAGKIDCLM
jgi:hypothetical protein